jgi:hypothetical protein
MDFRLLIATICVIIISTFGVAYWQIKESEICDELVIMNDGSQIEATEVTSYENGMSTIKMCDDTQMRTPTINIKFIKHIEK